MAFVGFKIFLMNSVGFLVDSHRDSHYWIGARAGTIRAIAVTRERYAFSGAFEDEGQGAGIYILLCRVQFECP